MTLSGLIRIFNSELTILTAYPLTWVVSGQASICVSSTIILSSYGGVSVVLVRCQAHSRRRRWPERPGFTADENDRRWCWLDEASRVPTRSHDAASQGSVNLTYGRRSGGCTFICLRRVGSDERDHSLLRLFRPGISPVRSLDSSFGYSGTVSSSLHDRVLTTTPEATHFHSATSSLRAMATMVGFLPRPPSTRCLNHSDRADCGWLRSHNHASSIRAVADVGCRPSTRPDRD